ncbi:hypothetical protein [Chitinophaga sp. GbtcB8]|uniref:alpha/beta hydrolase family protein n=1 Tax=Chitinophaga sp. GbtcB8 TaxID=2824753 RepID=UPI001C2F2710|nr:hypothetical protein [Chitinophaga sp. GbtcB8]
MMMKIFLTALLFAGTACAQTSAPIPKTKFTPQPTGVSQREFADSSRSNWLGTGPRPIRCITWYPSGAGGQAALIQDSIQFPAPVTAMRDAGLSARKKKYPLILISHGAQGHALHMRWLGYYLASRGYITVAVDHNGTDVEERKTALLTLSDFCMWMRPKDLSFVLDKLLQDPLFAGRIDTSRIGVAGLSLGGATAIWIAGARFDLQHLAANAPPPPGSLKADVDRLIALSKTDPVVKKMMLHSADDYHDKRIKAVFALAPAIGEAFTKEGLQNIRVPVQVVVGDEDVITPKETNAAHYAADIPTAHRLIVLPGERGHYTHPTSGTSRAVELQEVSQLAYDFFAEVLK